MWADPDRGGRWRRRAIGHLKSRSGKIYLPKIHPGGLLSLLLFRLPQFPFPGFDGLPGPCQDLRVPSLANQGLGKEISGGLFVSPVGRKQIFLQILIGFRAYPNEMPPKRPQEVGLQGCFHPLNMGDPRDQVPEGLVVGSGELRGHGAHAVLHPIQGRLVAGGGDAVQGDVETDDPEEKRRWFLVIGSVGPPGGGHFPDVSQTGEMIDPPREGL